MHHRLKVLDLSSAGKRIDSAAGNVVVDISTGPPHVREPTPHSKGNLALRHPDLGLAESVDHISHPSIDRKAVRMFVEELLRWPRSAAPLVRYVSGAY
jgi:hypothetical protein